MGGTSVRWSAEGLDPFSYRHEHRPEATFKLEHFETRGPVGHRSPTRRLPPFTVALYETRSSKQRTSMISAIGFPCRVLRRLLFTGITTPSNAWPPTGNEAGMAEAGEESPWKKFADPPVVSKIDHLNRGMEGRSDGSTKATLISWRTLCSRPMRMKASARLCGRLLRQDGRAVTSNRYLKILETKCLAQRGQR